MKIRDILLGTLVALLLTACQGGKTASDEGGDTLQMKYAELLTIVKHDNGAYTEAIIENPWKKGTTLHNYFLVPKGKEGDETVARLKDRIQENGALQMSKSCDIVRTPLKSNVVFTAPHCQLMYELGCKNAITGVCDKDYINITDIKERVKLSDGNTSASKAGKAIMDCGSSMQPNIERIITLKPEALFISPFENSGGNGKLDKLHIPIIETADYMETSPLGRAEWMKFYGMLFNEEQRVKSGLSEEQRVKSEEFNSNASEVSCELKADTLFSAIEKEYLTLKDEAAKLPQGLSILTERKMGSVWYVPGGKSTMGILLKDANAKYIFADDTHSGSLSLSPEQVLNKASQVDVWAFKYFGGNALMRNDLLSEYQGYKALKAFNNNQIFEVDTSTQPYFELNSFHPEILLREFIILAHPKATQFGNLRFYQQQQH